jgi:hypothetical protein
MLSGEIEQMEQRRLIDRSGVEVFDRDRALGEQSLGVRERQRGSRDHLGAAGRPPDFDQMAFARTHGPGDKQGMQRPIWPAVD